MKLLEFIKSNISVFNTIGFIVLIFSFYLTFIYQNDGSPREIIKVVYFIGYILSIILFVIDYIFKKIIKSRLNLNYLEFIILVLVYSYYSFTYIK